VDIYFHINYLPAFPAIGVDDAFVMLSVWRQTDLGWSARRRLAQTFSDAAASIAVTSLTDVMAFALGALSVFPAVRVFCAFSACTLALMFVFQLTFFGACLALMGRREAARRHCVTFTKIRLPCKTFLLIM